MIAYDYTKGNETLRVVVLDDMPDMKVVECGMIRDGIVEYWEELDDVDDARRLARSLLSEGYSMRVIPQKTTILNQCPRCSGTGHLSMFKHIDNGECFCCQGTGEGRTEVLESLSLHGEYIRQQREMAHGLQPAPVTL